MTQEWVYKATDTLASLRDTEALALDDSFLAKAAYVRGDKKARAAFVKAVKLGDIIHFYFKNRRDQAAHVVGSFEVTDHKIRGNRFSWPTEHTDLVTVIDPTFVRRLKSLGYEDDPQLGIMTGWALRPAQITTPEYDATMFPGMSCLRRRP